MAKDTTKTFQLQRIADHLEKQAGISPGRSEFDMTEEARLTRVADALVELTLLGGTASGKLSDLLDVANDLTPASGDVLAFDGSFWDKKTLGLGNLTPRDHDLLTGLSDDDHTQYLLADGSRPLTADWNVGTNEVTVDALILGLNARIRANAGTNDHLFLNAKGTGIVFLNFDDGTGGVRFSDGSGGNVANIDSSGNMQLDGDMTVDGEIEGSRMVLCAGMGALFSADTYAQGAGSAQMSATRGYKMTRPGSVVGIGWTTEVVSVTTGGTWAVRVRKNGTNVFAAQITLPATGDIGANGKQARGNDTFVAGDVISAFLDWNTFVGSVRHTIIFIEIVFDT